MCRGCRIQFRDRLSDLDLRELINNCKQKSAEKFYVYCNAILQLTNRLEIHVPDNELVEILKRELRPKTRKEFFSK